MFRDFFFTFPFSISFSLTPPFSVPLIPSSSQLDFASSHMKARDWSNVVSCHRDSDTARTWSTTNHSITAHRLKRTLPNGAVSVFGASASSSASSASASAGTADEQLQAIRSSNMMAQMQTMIATENKWDMILIIHHDSPHSSMQIFGFDYQRDG